MIRSRTAALCVLLLAASLGGTACYDGNRNQVPSWEPPTAAEKRAERIAEQANAKDAPGAPGTD